MSDPGSIPLEDDRGRRVRDVVEATAFTNESRALLMREGVDMNTLEAIATMLLDAIGEDPTREGLKDTPRRFASMWREFVEFDPGNTDTAFEHTNADQMVCVGGIKLWSVCEHHLLPFSSIVDVGYIAQGTVLGLSKIVRIAHKFAHRLQLQERLVEQIASAVASAAHTSDVAVVAKGEHLCVSMRGIRAPATMTTSVMRGHFLDKPEARAEFLRMVAS